MWFRAGVGAINNAPITMSALLAGTKMLSTT